MMFKMLRFKQVTKSNYIYTMLPSAMRPSLSPSHHPAIGNATVVITLPPPCHP